MNRTTLIRHVLITAAATGATLILAACGTNSGDSGSMANMPGTSQGPSAAAKSWNDADVTFAQMMIPDHQMIAKMAALAKTKASSAALKTLAGQIETGQTQAVTKLTGWLTAWGKPTTADMAGMTMPGAMTDADMTNLKSMDGMNFDMMFAQMMIKHHNGSTQMARDEQSKGVSVEAKAMADAMIKTQTAQVTELKKFATM
jgi:uncharacterized protein (DUF305 family)